MCDPARRVGIAAHAAITDGLFWALGGEDDPELPARVEAVLRACRAAFEAAARAGDRDNRVWFTAQELELWAVLNPAEQGEGQDLTVMLTTED